MGLSITRGNALVIRGKTVTLSANGTFGPGTGDIFKVTPTGAHRNFNPSGTFAAWTVVKVINASSTYNVVFDSVGSNQTVAPGELGTFIYDGTDWR